MNWKATGNVAARIAIVCAIVIAVALPAGGQAEDTELKARFILNFARMVHWTAVEGEEDSTRLPICALASSELFGAIRSTVKGQTAADRNLTALVTANPTPVQCRIVVFEAAQYSRAAAILKRLRNAPVLTIGDGPGFLDAGGMFELTAEGRTLQFDVKLEPIKRAGLEVSARLLRLSKSFRAGAANGT